MSTAQIFSNGRSQAVRIPKEYRFDVDKVYINKIGNVMVLVPKADLAAEHFGDIFADLEKKHMRIGGRDMLISGHARPLGYTLVTNNVRVFPRVDGLLYEDWKQWGIP